MDAKPLAPRKLLFLCVANSARSQLAEGLARARLPKGWQVQSAGSDPGGVNPFAVRVLSEEGIDISTQRSKSVETLDPASVDLVITLCKEEVCPTYLSACEHLHWPLKDPAARAPEDSDADLMRRFRLARDTLEERLTELGLPPRPGT